MASHRSAIAANSTVFAAGFKDLWPDTRLYQARCSVASDVQLSLIQTAPVSGAVVVTTPSDVSLEDARKAVRMFEQVKVPILGIVENMSYLICPHCEERIDVFSSGGGKRTALAMNINFMGALPLDPHVRIGGDTGKPIATFGPEDRRAKGYYEIADIVVKLADEASNVKGPTMTISD